MAISNGKYKGKLVGQVVLGASKNKGTPFIEVYGEITQGENKGGRAKWTGYMPKGEDGKPTKTAERTIEALFLCGWQTEDGELACFSDGELHGIGDNEVEFVIELEDYEFTNEETGDTEKRTTPRIQWINDASGRLNIQSAMSKPDAESFSSKMKGLVLKLKSRKPAVVAATEDGLPEFPPPEQKQASGQKKGW